MDLIRRLMANKYKPTRCTTMSPIPVHIKHAGKLFDINLDQDLPPNAFKEAIYLLTAVPVDRMKVMVKGGVLKVSLFFISNFILYSYTFFHRMTLLGRKLLQNQVRPLWS